jgi:hypothetical protein
MPFFRVEEWHSLLLVYDVLLDDRCHRVTVSFDILEEGFG